MAHSRVDVIGQNGNTGEHYMTELKAWQQKVQCANCKDIIYSKWEGDFVTCSCYRNEESNTGIAVDQTAYYARYLGTPSNFIPVE